MTTNKTAIFKVDEDYFYNNIEDELNYLIEAFTKNRRKDLKKFERYINGHTDIQNKLPFNQTSKINKKQTIDFAETIVNNEVSMLLGKDVEFYSTENELMDKVNEIFEKNHFNTALTQMLRNSSTFALGYMFITVNADGEIIIRYDIDSTNTFIIVSNDIMKKVLAIVNLTEQPNYYSPTTENKITQATLFTDDFINKYSLVNNKVKFIHTQNNDLGKLNIIYTENNDLEKSSFEKEISTIDAYELSESLDLDDILKYASAIMVQKGVSGLSKNSWIDEKTGETMYESDSDSARRQMWAGLLQIEDGDMSYLTKPLTITEGEIFRERMLKDLAITTGNVFLDSSIGANTSGISIEQRLQTLQNRVALKEKSLKRAIEQILKIIIGHINKMENTDYNYKDIKFKFNRNIPRDLVAQANYANMMQNILTADEIVNQLDLKDSNEIIKRIKSEKEDLVNKKEEIIETVDTITETQQI